MKAEKRQQKRSKSDNNREDEKCQGMPSATESVVYSSVSSENFGRRFTIPRKIN